MATSHIAPYGSWKSPITSDLIVAATIGFSQIVLDGDEVYWGETRPSEGGRTVIVRWSPDGQTVDMLPAPFNARTRVHEYGGGSFTTSQRATYFSHFPDQRLYRQLLGEEPQPLTSAGARRYADAVVDHRRNRLICVCEDHTTPDKEPSNALVSVDLRTGTVQTLVSGNDFYSSPRLSPDGARLSWLAWNHPNMPWDSTELWVGELTLDGTVAEKQHVTDGRQKRRWTCRRPTAVGQTRPPSDRALLPVHSSNDTDSTSRCGLRQNTERYQATIAAERWIPPAHR